MTVIVDGHEVHLTKTPSGQYVTITTSAAILFRLLKAAKDQGLKVEDEEC